MKIFYFDAQPNDAAALHAALPDHDVTVIAEPLKEETVAQASTADIVSVFVTSQVNASVIAQLPHVKLITARSAGYDHIDMATCQTHNITVANVPHYGETTVAEHTFALILALSRKIFQSYERTEKMNFDRTGLQGFDLNGKTIGVVGTGNIGRNVIDIALGFKMRVIAHDVHPDAAAAADRGFTYMGSLEGLLSQSDVVTLHVPYLKETHHLINKTTIKQIKKGALLINTARGALIDTEALLWAFEAGIVAGAGLDVLEEEHDAFDRIEFLSKNKADLNEMATLLRNHLLVSRDDVIITPHNAFNSNEAVQRIFDTTLDNIRTFTLGQPSNVVSAA